jgi:hypothetical protein
MRKTKYILQTFDKIVTVRNSDRPWFNSELRREIRKRDRILMTVKKYSKQSDIDKYKKQRNKVNNLRYVQSKMVTCYFFNPPLPRKDNGRCLRLYNHRSENLRINNL